MPRGDGTGPMGLGRGRGRGADVGWRRYFGRGRGIGLRRWFGRGLAGRMPQYYNNMETSSEVPRRAARFNTPAYQPPVAVVDAEKCVGCGSCVKVCPAGAIKLNSKAHIESELCRGCGICLTVCPKGAITFAKREDN